MPEVESSDDCSLSSISEFINEKKSSNIHSKCNMNTDKAGVLNVE